VDFLIAIPHSSVAYGPQLEVPRNHKPGHPMFLTGIRTCLDQGVLKSVYKQVSITFHQSDSLRKSVAILKRMVPR